jgi:hypothetical protein
MKGVRSWLLIARVGLVGVLAALAFPSDGSTLATLSSVSLTSAGPSPSTLTIGAETILLFDNQDSVTHTVVFANGLCSLTVTPGEQVGPDASVDGATHPDCNVTFPRYVGSYAYTVDGTFPGRVNTLPLRRSVTLTARTHRIRPSTQLTVHGQLIWGAGAEGVPVTKVPFPVIVLARHDRTHPFKPIATVAVKLNRQPNVTWTWNLKVRPATPTTYIAEANGQSPEGQVWTPARSRPFTVRPRR